MLTAVRRVFFTVEANGIQPVTPQGAGVQGEHNATEIVFQLPASWMQAGYQFHVEWVDGMQSSYVSDQLTVTDDTVSFLLPKDWTEAGGIGEMRLAAVLQGETEETSQTVYSAVARLSFLSRNGMQY